MGMPGQEWANMWPNSAVFILFIARTFPQCFIEIWWTKFKIWWKQYILGPIWPNLGLNNGHARARMGEHVTKLISLHSFHIKNISSKFHRNLMNQIRDILKTVYFGTKYCLIWAQMMGMHRQEWPNMWPNSSVFWWGDVMWCQCECKMC